MDPKMDELLRITKETNAMVHKMRRAQLWGRFYQIAWWVLIVAVSGYTYYVYAQPYVEKIIGIYTQIGVEGQKAQDLGSQVSSFFGSWVPHSATTTKVQ
jgi:hypothetical protein